MRLVVVSNRLQFTVSFKEGVPEFKNSPGGLSTGLASYLQQAKPFQNWTRAASADSSKSWDLRWAIREQFIGYIQKHHPQSLPQIRARIEQETL
jgi:hypothetical protein